MDSDARHKGKKAISAGPRFVPRWQNLCFSLLTRASRVLVTLWIRDRNRSQIAPDLGVEHWHAIGDDQHNSFTDMIAWRGSYYLVHASSPWHLASDQARLIAYRSDDARHWQRIREFTVPGEDIRDPKFAVIHDRLFLYVLKNNGFAATPYSTAFTATSDGETWSSLRDCTPEGWLFWRPKTRDGKTWYVPAYWHRHGKSILLRSSDGETWQEVSTIYDGECNDETDIEFFPDGRLLATARLEVTDNLLGHRDASTLIAVASPPYTTWERRKSYVTRLDGPNLFAHGDRIYGIGRKHEGADRFPFYFGSIFGRKRTALYRVDPEGLTHLTDFPSAGDTSYAGILRRDEELYVSYYTSDIKKDYPWILGMMAPTHIRMAKFPLARLAALEPSGSA